MAKMRHWKQRFRADAEMVWNRHGKYGSVQHKPGDPVPEGIGRSRLRLWFENHRIRLADPKGRLLQRIRWLSRSRPSRNRSRSRPLSQSKPIRSLSL